MVQPEVIESLCGVYRRHLKSITQVPGYHPTQKLGGHYPAPSICDTPTTLEWEMQRWCFISDQDISIKVVTSTLAYQSSKLVLHLRGPEP